AVEFRGGALVDVPVVTHRLIVSGVHRAGLDRPDRLPDAAYAQVVVDALVGAQGEVLGQHAQGAVGRDGSGRGGEVARGESEQGGLPGPVDADQPGTPRGHQEVEVIEHDGAVGPGEGDAGEAEWG